MTHRSNAYDVFVKFTKLTENLLDQKIKIFPSDGEGEFLSSRFRNFLSSHGISHQISCPHTPEQNGVVERKHRHVVETGLTLLAYSHMPPAYWLEAFNSAIFLINRMPTRALSNVSPWEILFQKPPDY